MSLNPSLFDSLGTQAQAKYEGPLSPVSMPSVSTSPDSIGFGGPTYAEQVLLGGAFPVLRSPTMHIHPSLLVFILYNIHLHWHTRP